MEISGKILAQIVKNQIYKELEKLSSQSITPKIAIVTLGEESSWQTYVHQKLKLAKRLGLKATLINITDNKAEDLFTTLKALNEDENTHGIIVQRPFPNTLDKEKVISAIDPQKDIDGFQEHSFFAVPVWLAVEHILTFIAEQQKTTLDRLLQNKTIAVVGKGETGGLPTINGLKKKRYNPIVIDSTTPNKAEILGNADIIISAVGKRVVEAKDIKKGAILIGIGVSRGEKGLQGDYDEEQIKEKAVYYTPTPGGVGPLNLAYLFLNLVKAAKMQQNKA